MDASEIKGAPRNTFAGLGSYLAFTLKHNLVRYLVWIAVIVGLFAYVAVYYKSLFTTQAELNQFIAISSAPGMTALVGKPGSATMGGAVWTKIWMTLAMTLAIGMVFQVTKGARGDEESGRLELVRSRSLGLHTPLTSAVSGALILSVVIGVLSVIVAHALGLDPAGTGIKGSLTFGLSLIGCGFLGVAVGALTNQLSASASLANSNGSLVIVAFFVLRMLGDMNGNALTWLSPIGWGEKMAPWGDDKMWLILPFLALTVVALLVAYLIEARRDFGSGVLKDKAGHTNANALMQTSWGFVLHLYKGPIIGWLLGMAFAGLLFGSVAKQMLDMIKNMKVGMLQGTGMDALLGLLLVFIAIVAMILPLQMMAGLRLDEARGLSEAQLAHGMSRYRLVLERFVIAVVMLVILLLVGGASMGASYGSMAHDMSQTGKMALDALIYVPGILAILSLVVVLFGFIPRTTVPVAWSIYGAMYFDVLIGDALKLPNWVNSIMPFTGTPRMPYEKFDIGVLWFALAAFVLLIIGLIGFRRRNINA